MELTYEENEIHLALRQLLAYKSKRDRREFTVYQLAKAISMPHSILIKLMHPDPCKRVHNPKVDTLTKIIDFFRQDGFKISLDDLISGLQQSSLDEIFSAPIATTWVSLYSMSFAKKEALGTFELSLDNNYDRRAIVAFLTEEDLKPLFKKGSIFIVNTLLEAEHDTLVAVKLTTSPHILIRKFYQQGQTQILKTYDNKQEELEFRVDSGDQIMGVIIQVNAKI